MFALIMHYKNVVQFTAIHSVLLHFNVMHLTMRVLR